MISSLGGLIRSHDRKLTGFSENRKVHFHINKILLMLPIQTQMIPVQNLKKPDTHVYGNVFEVLYSDIL